jgi:hypothetical protein
MNDGTFWLIVAAGLAILSALCFRFPVIGFFWFPFGGEDNGIAYVFAPSARSPCW